jgi:hypothetical protein
VKINGRAHGESLVLGWAIGVLHHESGGVRESSPLKLHLSELILGVRCGMLRCASQGGDHDAAGNVEIARITVELGWRPEGTTGMEARVQVRDISEN